MRRKEILTSTFAMNYLSFLSGVQVGACIHLLVSIYETSLNLLMLTLVIIGSVLIFLGGYLSAFISWEINKIITEGYRIREKEIFVKSEDKMYEMLSKERRMLFSTWTTEHLLAVCFRFDIILSAVGLLLIILPKFT